MPSLVLSCIHHWSSMSVSIIKVCAPCRPCVPHSLPRQLKSMTGMGWATSKSTGSLSRRPRRARSSRGCSRYQQSRQRSADLCTGRGVQHMPTMKYSVSRFPWPDSRYPASCLFSTRSRFLFFAPLCFYFLLSCPFQYFCCSSVHQTGCFPPSVL